MLSRRRLLTLAAGVGAGLAGCAHDEPDPTEVVVREPHPAIGAPEEATTDVEVRTLRVTGEEAVVSLGREDDDSRGRGRNWHFVLDDEDAASLRIDVADEDLADDGATDDGATDDGAAETDVDAVRSFVEGTDFAEASVVVHERSIGDCYKRHVEYVVVEPDRYRVQFCRRLREATTPCEADQTVMEALFVRVPRAYDTPPSSRGSGDRSRCHSDHWQTGSAGMEADENGDGDADGEENADGDDNVDGDAAGEENADGDENMDGDENADGDENTHERPGEGDA